MQKNNILCNQPLIKELTIADLPAVLTIEKNCQEAPWSIKNFTDCIDTGYDNTGLFVQDSLVGYLIASSIFEQAQVLNFCIHPRYQNLGLGNYLMQQSIEDMKQKNIRKIFLEVREKNDSAQRFYERFSFISVAKRANYYPKSKGENNNNQEDAIVMMKLL